MRSLNRVEPGRARSPGSICMVFTTDVRSAGIFQCKDLVVNVRTSPDSGCALCGFLDVDLDSYIL